MVDNRTVLTPRTIYRLDIGLEILENGKQWKRNLRGGTVQKQKFCGRNKIIVLLESSSGFSGFLERRLDFSTACSFHLECYLKCYLKCYPECYLFTDRGLTSKSCSTLGLDALGRPQPVTFRLTASNGKIGGEWALVSESHTGLLRWSSALI